VSDRPKPPPADPEVWPEPKMVEIPGGSIFDPKEKYPETERLKALWLGTPNEATPDEHLERATYWLSEVEAIAMKTMSEGHTFAPAQSACAKMLTDLASLHLDAAFAKRHIRPGRNLRP
jgi:hypothetical protein